MLWREHQPESEVESDFYSDVEGVKEDVGFL
jgi:hypothetical protein